MQIKNGKYRIRNYNISDWNNYASLHSIAAAEGKEEYLGISPEQIQLQLECSGNSFFKNLFLVEKNKEIIGSLFAVPEREIGRSVLYCFIHPTYRRRKIGYNLLLKGLEHSINLDINTMHLNLKKNNSTGLAFLKQSGFRPVRKYLEMQKSQLEEKEYNNKIPTDIYFRSLQPGEEKTLTQLQNDAFRGSWGFNPNTTAEIKLCFRSNNGSVEDVILGFFGEEPVGYCWTFVDKKKRIGRVHMIGIIPCYRKKHLGKLLLKRGLAYLAKKGMHSAVLTVDNENEPAKTLYNSAGFNVINTTLWFEKKIG